MFMHAHISNVIMYIPNQIRLLCTSIVVVTTCGLHRGHVTRNTKLRQAKEHNMSDKAKETTKALQKLSDQITCAICHEIYTDPRLLPCLHIYCKGCLEQVVRRELDKNIMQCPICRKQTILPKNGVGGLQSAFFIANYIDCYEGMKTALDSHKTFCQKCVGSEAVGYCNNCRSFICELCKLIHSKWPELKEHKIMDMGEICTSVSDNTLKSKLLKRYPKRCEKHQDEMLKIFCEECEKVICRDCLMDEHKSHGEMCKLVTSIAAKHKHTIEQCMQPMREQLTLLGEAIRKVDTTTKELEDKQLKTLASVDQQIQDQVLLLNERKCELITELQQAVQHKKKVLTAQKEQLETVYTQVTTCVQFFNDMLRNGTDVDILNLKRTLTERALEITTTANKVIHATKENTQFELSTESSLTDPHQLGLYIHVHRVCQPHSIITGDGVKKAILGEITPISLRTVDQHGRTCPIPVELITCELVSELTAGCLTTVHGQTIQQDRGTYKLYYKALTRGRNYLYIKIDGVNVTGSPFPVFVCNPNPIRIIKQLKYPWGVAAIDSNHIAVVESGDASSVSVITTDGTKQYTIGGLGTAPRQLNYPRGITCTTKGTLVVADYGNHRIQSFNQNGELLTTVGTQGNGPLQFKYPFSITTSTISGAIIVADQNNHRIQVLSEDFKFSHMFGSQGKDEGELSYPCGVAIGNDGSIFVADTGNNRIQVFTSDGQYIRQFGEKGIGFGQLQRPMDLKVDENTQNVLVADTDNHRISMFTIKGEYIGSFGSKGNVPGSFNSPGGVTNDKTGLKHYVVADYYNDRVQVF